MFTRSSYGSGAVCNVFLDFLIDPFICNTSQDHFNTSLNATYDPFCWDKTPPIKPNISLL